MSVRGRGLSWTCTRPNCLLRDESGYVPIDHPDPAHALRLLPARLCSVTHFFIATSWLVSVSATGQVRITTKPKFRKRNPPFRPIETLVHTNTTC